MSHSVAIIGSFKQHMADIGDAKEVFEQVGIAVLTPIDIEIIEPSIPFVRLVKDDPIQSDSTVQTITLHRILRADAVYVMAPKGYVGRTTCYEIGRIMQARRPIYFSEHPIDLPIQIPPSHIIAAADLAKKILTGGDEIEWPFTKGEDPYSVSERELVETDLNKET